MRLKNDRLLKAIRREPLDATPIWIMRQAGRYLPEYRALREQAGSFMRLCQTPELACEVTLQPIRRFDLDAAIIFSDILTIPDAMGMGLQFIEGKGPIFTRPLETPQDIKQLRGLESGQLAYVYDAISLVQQELNGHVPLIGFCGSPWTLALYMLEGKAVAGFPTAHQIRDTEPHLFHHLLSLLTEAIADHLQAQIEAGVQVVMIFDSWGGLLADAQQYESFSLFYIKQIIAKIKAYIQRNNTSVPIILFTKGGSPWLESLSLTGCEVVGLDWELSLKEARDRVGDKVVLQGNMHPNCLLKSKIEIQEEVKNSLAAFGKGPGHIFNLGHGITPDVSPDHVHTLVECVHEYSQAYHEG
jgi:uroporphyrinogen decarboxylase